MPISPKYAHSLFADLTQTAAVPLDPDELLHMPGLREHGHVFFGDIALPCYKHKARWMYDERDVRRAGEVFAELRVDLDDVVEVQLPAYRGMGERDPEEWSRPDWRRRLASWMYGQARRKVQGERPYEEWGAWKEIGDNGLPGGLTWEEFVAASSRYRHSQNIAGTRPLQLLAWSGESWLLPRAYTELLDRWQQRGEELAARARICSSCGTQGTYWGGWRTPTTIGFITLCPPCSGAAFQRYTGHLRGVLYESARRRGTRADDYLCRLCGARQAAAWDHCHDHGFVRGPLCGRCNTHEGAGIPDHFLRREGAALHLLECRRCREQRSLPHRYRVAVICVHLEETERHGRCRRRPYAREVEHAHGVHRFELDCGWHTTGQWTRDVTTAETARLMQAFVDAALAAQTNAPSPGAGTGEE